MGVLGQARRSLQRLRSGRGGQSGDDCGYQDERSQPRGFGLGWHTSDSMSDLPAGYSDLEQASAQRDRNGMGPVVRL
jgi:hypothetical protein